MSGKFLSVDSNWLSLDKKATYCQDDEYRSKSERRGWRGIDEPLRKGGMTGNNSAWELLPAADCGPFPQDVGGPVPFRLLHQWNFKSSRDRVNWVHFGRVAYPCASQLGASRSGPTAQVWPPGTHPWCEGVFPEKGDRCDSGGLYCLRPLQSQAGEHCVTTGPEHTRGGRDLREDVRFAQTRRGTPSPVTFIRHTSMLIWRQECYRDAGSGWR